MLTGMVSQNLERCQSIEIDFLESLNIGIGELVVYTRYVYEYLD